VVKILAFHSSRGGTGKSLIASNLAAILAEKGRSVALLDFNFRAPSLATIFNVDESRSYWLDSFLAGECGIEETLVDITERYGTRGRFLIGLADPRIEAMSRIASVDRRWQTRALRRILSLRKELDVEFIFLDTSPGVEYSSVNAIASSDLSILVSTMDLLDLEGAQRIIRDLYDAFEKKTLILINKAMPHELASDEGRKRLLQELAERFSQPILAVIPCYCDLLLSNRSTLFALEHPDHPFSGVLREVAKKLEEST